MYFNIFGLLFSLILSPIFSLIFSLTSSSLAQVIYNPNNSFNSRTTYRKIVGADNSVSVDTFGANVPFKFQRALEAVGLMDNGCTATHIGNGFVISAGHCVGAGSNPRYQYSCAGIKVYWGIRGTKSASSISNCIRVIVSEDSTNKDYALFKVNVPPRTFLPIRLQGSAYVGERISIFSHPFSQPLVWSGVCQVMRTPLARQAAGFIIHRCDTNPVSSGAAILDQETSVIVGIHDGGWSNGPVGYNYGTSIDQTLIPYALKIYGNSWRPR